MSSSTHDVSWEVELGLVGVLETVVEEELVQTKVAVRLGRLNRFQRQSAPGVVSHFVDTRVREVGEDVSEVESRHGQLRDDHL